MCEGGGRGGRVLAVEGRRVGAGACSGVGKLAGAEGAVLGGSRGRELDGRDRGERHGGEGRSVGDVGGGSV